MAQMTPSATTAHFQSSQPSQASFLAPLEISNALLDRMQYLADPLADTTINNILGDWLLPDTPTEHASGNAVAGAQSQMQPQPQWQTQLQPNWQKLAMVSAIFEQWTDNQNLVEWDGDGHGIPADIAEPLKAYVQAASSLPPWADKAKIARAEELFMDYGALSVTLLFCASLPECYVVPDLAAVLQTTGKLINHAEYRVRSTGAMIFPVMMHGGLTSPVGGGIAQVFKVRLIHATVRNLILRGNPEAALAAMAGAVSANPNTQGAGVIAPLATLEGTQNMHQTLFARGWNLHEDGVPCNQEDLGYTLLTFSYIFLRSMRKLGLGFSASDEEAYLHAWNVMAYFLGVNESLMPNTMAQAEAMFKLIQARGRQDQEKHKTEQAESANPDPRPLLGRALMDAMKQAIPLSLIKPFPVMLTRYLCGPATSKDLGLSGWISFASRFLFATSMQIARAVDAAVRFFVPGFSICRLIMRILGYRFICQLLMDQTRPLKVPLHVRESVNITMAAWGNDANAPKWVNAVEDYFTVKGNWQRPPQK